MGVLIANSIRRNKANPFAGMVSRGADGAPVFDLARAASSLGGADSARFGAPIKELRAALGDTPTIDALRGYSREYEVSTGGDADERTTSVFAPFGGDLGKQALDSTLQHFEITEKGQADAARIAQEGREKAAIANMGSGIASAQRRALGAAEQNAYDAAGGQEGGVADVVEGSNIEEAGGEEGGNDVARRKRQSYGGAGLAMRI